MIAARRCRMLASPIAVSPKGSESHGDSNPDSGRVGPAQGSAWHASEVAPGRAAVTIATWPASPQVAATIALGRTGSEEQRCGKERQRRNGGRDRGGPPPKGGVKTTR